MPNFKLTQSFVDDATGPADKQKVDWFDTEVPGLLLKVLKSGKRSYYIRYQNHRGKATERVLFDASIVDLKQARSKAKEYLARIALGEDPFAEKSDIARIKTLKEFIHEDYLPYVKTQKRSWKLDESQLRNHVEPTIGGLYMDQINMKVVSDFIFNHRKGFKASSVNRLMSVLSRLFELALTWETKGIKENPMKHIKKFNEGRIKERLLSDDEMRALMEVLSCSGNEIIADLITLLILTGARKSEGVNAKWEHIDYEKKEWLIPLSKSGKPRVIQLSDGAVVLLKKVECQRVNEYVFPNPKTMLPYVNLFPAWDSIRRKAGLNDLRIHDLRHNFASILVNSGCEIYTVKDLLGHSSVRTTERYAHLSRGKLSNAVNLADSVIQSVMRGSKEPEVELV